MMTVAERETLLKNLADSRERLLGTVQGLSHEQLHYRLAPGRWTVAECVEHIATVEGRVLGLIQKTLGDSPTPAKRCAMEDSALVENVAGRITRFPAPEYVVPRGQWPDER